VRKSACLLVVGQGGSTGATTDPGTTADPATTDPDPGARRLPRVARRHPRRWRPRLGTAVSADCEDPETPSATCTKLMAAPPNWAKLIPGDRDPRTVDP
jgi:hypothetical protein